MEKKKVPAEINENATAVFIAQAPGSWEEKREKPLIGDESDKKTAGWILSEILNELDYEREDFSYTNIYNIFPGKAVDGHDVPPTPEEIEEQYPRLIQDLENSRCKLIITLGKMAENTIRNLSTSNDYKAAFSNKEIVYALYPSNANKKKLKTQLAAALKKTSTE